MALCLRITGGGVASAQCFGQLFQPHDKVVSGNCTKDEVHGVQARVEGLSQFGGLIDDEQVCQGSAKCPVGAERSVRRYGAGVRRRSLIKQHPASTPGVYGQRCVTALIKALCSTDGAGRQPV
ncbi:hypothetical protein DSECCO2_600910 [anaerobic digester metagenome]